jgi:hypothetical protein
MKRLGPELKMPALKAPTFLADLWWDLWDRRLLPLVALVAVAIGAVPFLLGGGSGESPAQIAARQAAAAAAAGEAGGGSTTLTVVEAKPGLRDYRKRLARRSPTNPFVQRFATPVQTAAGKLNQPRETTTTTTTTSGGGGGGSSGAPSSETTPSGHSPAGKTGGGAPSHLTFFTFAINVKIVRSGGKQAEAGEKPQSWTKKRVLPLTPLPGEKAPVVTYMGTSKKGKPLLLVSTDVRSVFGEGRCVSGDETCQLIEVEPGFPETFVYGVNEVHYTINVLKVKLVVVKRT